MSLLLLLRNSPAAVDGPELDLVWDTRAQVDGGQLDLLWDLKGEVGGPALDLLWDTRAVVDAPALDLIWDLAGAPTSAVDGSPLRLVWDLLAQVAPPAAGGGGASWIPPVHGEVSARPLRLWWGSVKARVEGALTRMVAEAVERPAPAPAPRTRKRMAPPRLPEAPPAPQAEPVRAPRVSRPSIRLPRLPRPPERPRVEARLVLRWTATEDALEIGRLLERLERHTAELDATRGEKAQLEQEIARLRDDADALEALLLSER